MATENNLVKFPTGSKPTCPVCEAGDTLTSFEEERFTYGIGDRALELTARIPVRRCTVCGFEFTDDEADIARHEAVCRHLAVLTPAEIQRIRDRHSLSRAEFARLTRIGEASLARWEKGLLIQNAATDSYLRLLSYIDNLEVARSRRLAWEAEDDDRPDPQRVRSSPMSRGFRGRALSESDERQFRSEATIFQLRRAS
jgi:putative zinc finger/helix-turn-helix YgiT family protein